MESIEKKDDINNDALKAGIWYTISNFLLKGISFLTMPIFTRIMTSYDIGLFSNITSWVSLLTIITTFEIYTSINIARFDYKEDLNSYISSSLFLGTLITSIFYIFVIVFHEFFENIFMMDFQTLNIVFIYLLVHPAVEMFQIKNRIKYKYKPTIMLSFFNIIFSTAFSIILTLTLSNQLHGRIYGHYIPLILMSLIIYIYLLFQGKSISKKYWKYALMISFPLIWHLLANYLLSSVDKIMITKMVSPEANALYSVSYTISTIVSILGSSMNNAWSPWAYQMMDEKKYENLKNNSKPYIIFFLIVIFTMMLITPELLLIMGGQEYIEAKYVMPPVMVGYIFQFIYSLYFNIEFYHKKQKNIAIGTIIAAIINIILNLIFIPLFGYIAAAYTTLIGYIVLFIIHFLFVKKLGCIYWYDTKFFAKILIGSIILMLLFNILYYFNIIRYIIFVIIIIMILIILIKNKKEIVFALKNKSLKSLLEIFNRNKVFNKERWKKL